MAEIKIEKKKPIWPWILLLLLIAAAVVIYFMTQDNEADDMDSDDVEIIDDNDSMESDDMSDDVSDDTANYSDEYSRQETDRIMMDYRTSFEDSTKVGTDMDYTVNSLSQLVKAVEIKARQFNVDASQTIDSLQMRLKPNNATNTANNSTVATKNMGTTTMNTGLVKKTATEIVGVMRTIQLMKFPNMSGDITDLQDQVGEINEEMTLAQQKSEVRDFLNDAADVLNNMN